MATKKQVNYAMHLLDEAGYGTRYMNASFKALGASMRQRSGTVQAWLEGMSVVEISRLIDRLKQETGG